jgi:hypothetical protein
LGFRRQSQSIAGLAFDVAGKAVGGSLSSATFKKVIRQMGDPDRL